MRALGSELRSSERAAGSLKCSAISLAPLFDFLIGGSHCATQPGVVVVSQCAAQPGGVVVAGFELLISASTSQVLRGLHTTPGLS